MSSIARLQSKFSKGKTEMNTILTNVENAIVSGLAAAEAEAKAIEGKIAGAIEGEVSEPIKTDIEAAAGALDSVLTKVASIMTIAGRTPKAWDKITKLAQSSVGDTDPDKVLARAKDLVAFSGTKVDVWDDVVDLAKAIA